MQLNDNKAEASSFVMYINIKDVLCTIYLLSQMFD